MQIRQSELLTEASLSEHARFLCDSGVITPDHVIRTKGAMLLLEDVPDDDRALREAFGRELERYMAAYEDYFTEQAAAKGVQRTMLDPLPRLALVRGLGLLGLGRTRRAAKVAADIGEHAIRVKLQSRLVGAYLPCDPGHVFDMEYWSLDVILIRRPSPRRASRATGSAPASARSAAGRCSWSGT